MGHMGSSKGGRRVRRKFSEEFRAGAVRLVLDEGKTMGAVPRELDLTPSSLANWVRHAQADRTKGRSGLTTEERAELAGLRKENRELRMRKLPRQVDTAKRDWPADEGLGKNVSGGTR